MKLGEFFAQKLSSFVGTWFFVFLYATSFIVWAVLHRLGYARIDSEDFALWSLWATFFSGIQASIVLMAQNSEAAKDRVRNEVTQQIVKQNLDRAQQISQDLDSIEEILIDLRESEND